MKPCLLRITVYSKAAGTASLDGPCAWLARRYLGARPLSFIPSRRESSAIGIGPPPLPPGSPPSSANRPVGCTIHAQT